ncbi:MAG: L-ribulose-5-phosphate 3-epimerase [Clostridiales bacterium]|nr:L-ribulose-5-phosphate 3-epimerase [Clostridiales bacterium]
MAELIVLSKMTLTMEEGFIGEWHVREGDAIKLDDPLCSVENEKETDVLLSIYEGTILKIIAKEGDRYPVNSPIAVVGEPGEDFSALLAGAPVAAPAAGASSLPQAGQAAGPLTQTGQADGPGPETVQAAGPLTQTEPERIMPKIRLLIREKGIDKDALLAFCNGRKVTEAEVEAFEKAGAPAPLSGGADSAPLSGEAAPAPGMRKPTLSELPLGLYEKSICTTWPWEDKFSLVKEAGYDYLEIAVDATPQKLDRLYDKEEKLAIRRASEKYDMPLYTFIFTANRFFPLGSRDGEIREKGVALLCDAIDFASYVGARIVQIAGYDEYEKPRGLETEGHFRNSLELCLGHAALRGVIISLETIDTDFLDTTHKAMRFVREFDSAYLQIGVDPGNITAMGHNPVTDMPVGGKHIVKAEFKDVRPGQVRDVFYGSGVLDFGACFKTLNEIGFRGFLTAEMWAYDDPEFHPNIFKAFEFLKAAMAGY